MTYKIKTTIYLITDSVSSIMGLWRCIKVGRVRRHNKSKRHRRVDIYRLLLNCPNRIESQIHRRER